MSATEALPQTSYRDLRHLLATPLNQGDDGVILVHRCTCGHPDIYHHKGLLCSHGQCLQKCKQFDSISPEPELIPTFLWRDGRVEQNELILAPGSAYGPKAQPDRLCNCERCQEIYANSTLVA